MSIHMVPVMLTVAGVLIFALCLPLAMGKIPPNHYYGIRTTASYSSTESWYTINKFGGKRMLWASLVVFLAGLAGFLVPAGYLEIYFLIGMIVSFSSIITAVITTLHHEP